MNERIDRYAPEYRRACLEAGHELVARLPSPAPGEGHALWTGEVFHALRLVAWGGGPAEDVARAAALRLRRPVSDAVQSAREARKADEPPPLPPDAWERLLGALRGSEPASGRAPPAPAPAATVRPAERPPWAEVKALLDQCVEPASDPEVAGWLQGRGIPLDAPGDYQLRALPADAVCPAWARGPLPGGGWGPWARAGYRALLPLWDPNGWIRSVVARAVRPADPKSLPPTGFGRRGLVLANPAAVSVLAGNAAPERVVLVVEGEPDWLTMVAVLPGVPVIGVASGSWRSAFAARFSDSTTWHLATDDNAAGDGYAAEVAAALPGSATVYRTRVRNLAARRGVELPGADWNDAARAGLFRLNAAMTDLMDASTPYPRTP